MDAYFTSSSAQRTGTAKFEPPKSLRMAKFTPITLPWRLKSGPPEPPDVVPESGERVLPSDGGPSQQLMKLRLIGLLLPASTEIPVNADQT